MHFYVKRYNGIYKIFYGLKYICSVEYPYRDDMVHMLIACGFVDKRYEGDIQFTLEN